MDVKHSISAHTNVVMSDNDALFSLLQPKLVLFLHSIVSVENFQDVSVHVSDAVTHDDLSQDDLCSETMGTPSLGEVITLPCSGGVKTGRYVW